MAEFIGRKAELERLNALLPSGPDDSRIGRPGRTLLIRGRRRVGKSRLVEEFINRTRVPHVFFTAIGGSREHDLTRFAAEVTTSDLPDAHLIFEDGAAPGSWNAALRTLATSLPADKPSIVVLDEMPYLVSQDPTFEGALQMVFDRFLSRLPVMLILIGSDIAMMEKLNTYGRPFYQRGTEMVVPPLNPRDVGALLSLNPSDAFDAYLVTGGLPLILDEWPRGATLWDYLEEALKNPTSALLVSGERALAAEFPTETQARHVLRAIGHGECTFTTISNAAGGLSATTLTRSLNLLTERRVIAADLPLSTKPSRQTRYRIDDPHLRFWLSFLGPAMPAVERGRGDRVIKAIRNSWTTWRGRAIEPVIRDALWLLAYDLLPEGTEAVGSYWTRTNDPEIDLIGADCSPVAKKITFVGSVKWLENKAFGIRDYDRLARHRDQLPGANEDTPLIAVSRSGSRTQEVTTITPDDLLDAWN